MANFIVPGAIAAATLISSIFESRSKSKAQKAAKKAAKKGGATPSSNLPGPGQKFDIFTPQQQQLQNQLINQLGSQLQPSMARNQPTFQAGQSYITKMLGGGPEAFSAFEAPLMRQYNEQILPGIAEKYAGLGAQSSSAFQNELAGAGAGLMENLGAQRANLQMNLLAPALAYGQTPYAEQQALLPYAMTPSYNTAYNMNQPQGGAGGNWFSNYINPLIGSATNAYLQYQMGRWLNPATPGANPNAPQPTPAGGKP